MRNVRGVNRQDATTRNRRCGSKTHGLHNRDYPSNRRRPARVSDVESTTKSRRHTRPRSARRRL